MSASPVFGVFGIPILVVMGELGTGVARFSWFPWDMLFCFPLAILLSVICSCLSLVHGLCPWISTGPGGRWSEPCSEPQSHLVEQRSQCWVPGP